MAEIKTVKINVETQSAVSAMDNLSKATHDVSQSFEEVYGDLQPLTTRMGEAEDRLYELANAGKTTTKEYKDLLKTVGDYRKVQINTDLAVDSAATTMGQKLGGALTGATAGFSVVTGVMGTFGAESEEIEKLLLRVNAAMAMAQGLQGLKEAAPLFIQLKDSAKIALEGIKTGIAATGIGVLLLAVGAIVAYWDDIKSVVNGVSAEQEELNALAGEQVKIEQDKLNTIGNQDNILKLQGKSEKDILKLKAAQTDEVISATKEQINQTIITSKAQTKAAERNHKLTKGILAMMQAPVMLLLGAVDALTYGLEKVGLMDKGTSLANDLLDWEASFFFDPAETKAEGEAVIAEQKASLAKLENDRAGHKLRLNAIETQANNKSSANRKIATDNKKQDAADKLEIDAKYEIEKAKIEAEANAKRIAVEDAQFKLLQELQNEGKDKEIAALIESYDAKFLIANENAELEKQLEEQLKKDIAAINEKHREAEEKKDKDSEDKKKELKINAVSSGLSVISNLAELFAGKSERQQKQAFKIQKAVNIASAVVDTYKAANAALASAPVPFNFIAMGATITAGLLNIKKIAATEFNSSATSSGEGSASSASNIGGGGGGQQQAPQFNVVGNSGINQLAQLQQQPTQAYVVSGAVTSAQSLDRNRIQNATIG